MQRPKSAYFLYMDEMRPKFKVDFPELSVSDMGKKMGEEWNKIKETPAADKYRKLAVHEKERYEREMKEYRAKKN